MVDYAVRWAATTQGETVNRSEADRILKEHVQLARSRSWNDLRTTVGDPENHEVAGPSGASYQIETQALWDDHPEGNLRVIVSIDDGGLRAFVPLTDDFILSKVGRFVGE
jgi:hypothetical protein